MQDPLTVFVQIVVSGLTVGSGLALVALGYNFVFSATRIVNFAQGTMIVVAGYVAFALTRTGVPIGLAFAGAVMASAVVGALVERVAVRPLGRIDPATNVAWILTTFSVGLIALDLVRLTVDSQVHALPDLAHSFFGWQKATVAGVPIVASDVLLVVTTVGLMIGISAIQARTAAGRAFRAVAEDRQAASLMGINATRVVVATFAIAGALAAVSAVLLAPRLGVRLQNGEILATEAFVCAVLGGLGSTRGAVAGGYTVALVSAGVRSINETSARFESLVIFALFLAVLVVRPTGIFGSPYVEKV